jgi:MoxR-like ATPase
MLKINLKELEGLLENYYDIRQSLYLWGKPSSGKTSMIRQFAKKKAKELNLKYSEDEFGKDIFTCKIIPLSQYDSPDLRGMPEITGDKIKITRFIPSAELPREGQGIIFLDELNMSDDTTRAAAYQYILEGRYSNLEPVIDKNGKESFWRVAASNSEQDYCSVNTTSLALLRRFCHLEVEPDLEEILTYLHDKKLDSRVIAYLRNFPEDLFPKEWNEKLLDKKANPFPYTWEVASRLINEMDLKNNQNKITNLVGSCVGPEVATRFNAYIKLTKTLDMNKLIANPEDEIKKISSSPDKSSLFYSVISTLTSYWYIKKKSLTAKKVVKIGGLLPAEFSVAFLKLVIRKRANQLTTVPELNTLLRNLGIYLDL